MKRGLIVSCQAEEGSPFNAPEFMAAFVKAAELGGAVGVRVRDPENVAVARKTTRLPVIGLTKGYYATGRVLITPTIDEAIALRDSGADVIAVDATMRMRPDGVSGPEFLKLVKSAVSLPIMADVSNLEEALLAADIGADFVSTTLSGYTEFTSSENNLPDLDLIRDISSRGTAPVIAEGRIWTPEQARKAIALGAYAVCVGTAITRPVDIVRRFSSSLFD